MMYSRKCNYFSVYFLPELDRGHDSLVLIVGAIRIAVPYSIALKGPHIHSYCRLHSHRHIRLHGVSAV